MSQKDKDLCKTCGHYWLDFPLPLDHYESHCEIIDKNYINGVEKFAEVVPYPCLECPFNCYTKKRRITMTTIKSHTDLEQSKVLAEILPLESADMRYSPLGMDMHPWIWTDTFIEKDAIPCWSLAALLSQLPKYNLDEDDDGKGNMMHSCSMWTKKGAFETSANNPVDACYKLILKLNELKKL